MVVLRDHVCHGEGYSTDFAEVIRIVFNYAQGIGFICFIDSVNRINTDSIFDEL